MDAYLLMLQSACSGYVQLCRLGSRLLSVNARSSALRAMKEQLSQSLSGTASSVLRQQMAEAVLMGRYPTVEFKNQYEQR